jgi:hypothetical protein
MPLNQSALAKDLERILGTKHASTADAAAAWAKAYQTYAAGALSTAASLPVTVAVNATTLVGGFSAGLSALTSVTAAAIIAQSVTAFWQAMAWLGPTAAGTTSFPGNAALAGALASVFSDLSGKSAAAKASDLASAFDAGAKAVVVSDVPFIPAAAIVGPIM